MLIIKYTFLVNLISLTFTIENTQSVNIIITIKLCEREIFTKKLLKKIELEKYNSL